MVGSLSLFSYQEDDGFVGGVGLSEDRGCHWAVVVAVAVFSEVVGCVIVGSLVGFCWQVMVARMGIELVEVAAGCGRL